MQKRNFMLAIIDQSIFFWVSIFDFEPSGGRIFFMSYFELNEMFNFSENYMV